MECLAGIARRSLLGIGFGLFVLLASAAAQNPAQQLPEDRTPWASSSAFDLEPTVARASLDLPQPNLHALYDAIARSYGVKLIFDPDLGERPVGGDIHLRDATLKEALEAAGTISRTFVAPLDPHTGVVADDTPEKRAEHERQLLASFHMDAQLTPQQLTDISNTLRNIVDMRRVTQDTRTNWITVMGRSRQVAAAGEVIQSLEKANGEVMLEIDVWELDTNRARELGILPPQRFTLQWLGSSSSNLLVPLLHWGQVQTLYGLQIPGVTAFLTSSASLVRSHQTLHLRATDGEEARLLVGSRIPVVTGIINSVIQSGETGGQAAGQTLDTQGFIPGIQYQDVGVVIHATPHLHAAGEITLQLDFALRSLGPTADNGLPSFLNRQLTSQVRLNQDEAYLLGGILTRTDQSDTTGYPWLARIPLIGWLFSDQKRQHSETELLILLRPRILRNAAAAEFASRAIYFGKELTGLPAAPAVPPPQPVGQPPGGVPPQSGVPPQPGVAPFPGQVPQQPPQPQPGAPVPGAFPQGVVVAPGVSPVPQPVPQQPAQPQPESPPNYPTQ